MYVEKKKVINSVSCVKPDLKPFQLRKLEIWDTLSTSSTKGTAWLNKELCITGVCSGCSTDLCPHNIISCQTPQPFLRDELKNTNEQEPGPILPKFISSSITLQPHELHHFKRQQNSPSQFEFPRLQSQGDSAWEKKSSNWPWIDLQALVKRKQENQRRPSTK